MTPQLLRHPGVGVRVLAQRVVLLATGATVAASDGEGHNYSIAGAEILHVRPHFDDLAHELMPEHVPALERGDEAIIEMQVRTADCGRGDPHDRVATVQKLWVGHFFHVDLLLAAPAIGFHDRTCLLTSADSAE